MSVPNTLSDGTSAHARHLVTPPRPRPVPKLLYVAATCVCDGPEATGAEWRGEPEVASLGGELGAGAGHLPVPRKALSTSITLKNGPPGKRGTESPTQTDTDRLQGPRKFLLSAPAGIISLLLWPQDLSLPSPPGKICPHHNTLWTRYSLCVPSLQAALGGRQILGHPKEERGSPGEVPAPFPSSPEWGGAVSPGNR